jgi:hypothetical protein
MGFKIRQLPSAEELDARITKETVRHWLNNSLKWFDTPTESQLTNWKQLGGFKRIFAIHAILYNKETDRYGYDIISDFHEERTPDRDPNMKIAATIEDLLESMVDWFYSDYQCRYASAKKEDPNYVPPPHIFAT